MRSPDITPAELATLAALEPRIGRLHIRQRLGLEHDYEARVFRRGRICSISRTGARCTP